MTPHLNHFIEMVQLRGHNIWPFAEFTKTSPNVHQLLHLIYTPENYSKAPLISLPIMIIALMSRLSLRLNYQRTSGISRDQARGLNEGEVSLILGRSICSFFIFSYIFYTLKFLLQLKTGRSLNLQGDFFSQVSL